MSDRLQGIAVFVEVVEAGSFAAAAQRLRLTRSAVSKNIAQLEQRLAVRLFNRTTRSQSLTVDGVMYYERCERAMAELNAGSVALEHGRVEPTGLLRVSVPVMFGRHCVAPILRQLPLLYPTMQLEISFNDHVLNLVDHAFDLAVRIGVPSDSATLVARRLGAQKMMIYGSPDYLKQYGTDISTANIHTHVGIVYGRGRKTFAWSIFDDMREEVQIHPVSRIIFDDLQAIADACVAGLGLARLPCWLANQYETVGQLIPLASCEKVVAADISAVWQQSRYLPSKTRVAIDMLVANIPAYIGIP